MKCVLTFIHPKCIRSPLSAGLYQGPWTPQRTKPTRCNGVTAGETDNKQVRRPANVNLQVVTIGLKERPGREHRVGRGRETPLCRGRSLHKWCLHHDLRVRRGQPPKAAKLRPLQSVCDVSPGSPDWKTKVPPPPVRESGGECHPHQRGCT